MRKYQKFLKVKRKIQNMKIHLKKGVADLQDAKVESLQIQGYRGG